MYTIVISKHFPSKPDDMCGCTLKNTTCCNGGRMQKVFIGLNQGLTKAGEEVVSIISTVRYNY